MVHNSKCLDVEWNRLNFRTPGYWSHIYEVLLALLCLSYLGVIQCTTTKQYVTRKWNAFYLGRGVLIKHIWGTFDFGVFNMVIGLFSAHISKWLVTKTALYREKKTIEICNTWILVKYIYRTFDLSQCLFGSRWYLIQTWFSVEWN